MVVTGWTVSDGKISGKGLPVYERHGFVPVARLKFNDKYAPADWNYERDGRPDVIFYVHNGDSVEAIISSHYERHDLSRVPYVKDYDEGTAKQKEILSTREVGGAGRHFRSLSEGNTVTAYTDNNDPIEVKYAISEAANLVTSHDTGLKVNPDYPEELQPRQRERAASELQVNRIANRLNPRGCGESHDLDGAPVVGPDGVVETGNGRTIAIKKYTSRGPTRQSYTGIGLLIMQIGLV